MFGSTVQDKDKRKDKDAKQMENGKDQKTNDKINDRTKQDKAMTKDTTRQAH
jgi:hypothetical protein